MSDNVDAVLAKLKAKADAARASQDQAAAVARAKPRVSDPDSSVMEAPAKPAGDYTPNGTRILKQTAPELGVPKADSRPFDSAELNHNVPVESDLHSTSAPPSTAVTESMPKNGGSLASKASVAKSPMNAPAKALKTIAQDVADVKAPEVPLKPLAGQGANASGPVKAAYYNEKGQNVPKLNTSKPVRKITPAKVESSNPAPAAEKVMTPEGSVEKIAAEAPAKSSGVAEAMQAANKAYQPAEKIASREMTRDAYKASVSTGNRVAEDAGSSLMSKAASALRKAPSAVKGLGSIAKGAGEVADDLLLGGATKPYRALMAQRAAGTAAKTGVKAIGGEALAIGKGAAKFGGNVLKGVAVQAAAEGGYKLGSAAKTGMDEAKSTAQSQARQGAKYGLKVSSSADTAEGSNFLTQTARDVGNAVKIASGFADPTPTVTEDSTLKSKFNKKRLK